MKKILIGCGVLVALVVIAGVIGAGWLFKSFKSFGHEMETAQKEFQSINREFPFTAPADGKLDEARFLAWLDLREKIQAGDQKTMSDIQKNGPRAAFNMVRNMPEQMRQNAALLREARISQAEYAWITRQVMGALKNPMAMKDPDPAIVAMAKIATNPTPQEARDGKVFYNQNTTASLFPLPDEPAESILKLIKPHAARLREVIGMGMSDGMIVMNEMHLHGEAGKAGNESTTR